MPSVRVLALEASVNPNTMQKALAELENQGLLFTQRTSGRTVTTDERLLMELRERIASYYIEQYFEGMLSLGIGRNDAVEMIATKTGVASTVAPTVESIGVPVFVPMVATTIAPTVESIGAPVFVPTVVSPVEPTVAPTSEAVFYTSSTEVFEEAPIDEPEVFEEAPIDEPIEEISSIMTEVN